MIFLCSGLFVYETAACYYSAVIASSVSTAVILMYTAPVYVMVFSVTFLGERFKFPKLVAVVFMIAGCGLVSGIIGGMKFSLIGILLGVASGIVYSGYNILTRIEMMNGSHSGSATLYAYTVMAVVGLSVCRPMEIVQIVSDRPGITVLLMIGMGICTCTMPYFLYTLALRDIPAGTASALGILEPVAATVFSVVFLKEHLTIASVCGILLVLAAVLILKRFETKTSECAP